MSIVTFLMTFVLDLIKKYLYSFSLFITHNNFKRNHIMQYREFSSGRRFVGRLDHGRDLIASLEAFAVENGIEMAIFSVIGAVMSATLGCYDQQQQVYVSFQENSPLEIISCTGNVSLKDGKPFVHAHAVLSDDQGKTIGGHLFSETPVFAGEFDVQEVNGKPFSRQYDHDTGLMLWSNND